jgi:antitoxin ParD1/3/4
MTRTRIALDAEGERFVREQLETGRYASAEEVVAEALKLLRERERGEVASAAGRAARERLAARVERFRSERDRARERSGDPNRRELTRQLRELGERTRALPGVAEITEEEIAAEIEAYRRGG